MKTKSILFILIAALSVPLQGQVTLTTILPDNATYSYTESDDTSIIRAVDSERMLVYLFHAGASSPSRFVLHNYASGLSISSIEQVALNSYLTLDSIKVTDMCVYGDTCYFCGYQKVAEDVTYSQEGGAAVEYASKGIVGKFSVGSSGCTISGLRYAVFDRIDRFCKITTRDGGNYLTLIGRSGLQTMLLHINIAANHYEIEYPRDPSEEITDMVDHGQMLMLVSRFVVDYDGVRSLDSTMFGIRLIKDSEPRFYGSAFNLASKIDRYNVQTLAVTGGNLSRMATSEWLKDESSASFECIDYYELPGIKDYESISESQTESPWYWDNNTYSISWKSPEILSGKISKTVECRYQPIHIIQQEQEIEYTE